MRRSCPRIYEGGGPRSGRGSPPQRWGRPSQSRFACQLSQRESRGRFAPFLPPHLCGGRATQWQGEFPRRSGESLLSHASCASSPKGRAKGASPCQLPRRGSRGGLCPDHRGFPGKANRFSCRGASKFATSQELNIYPLFFFIIAWYHKDKPIQFLHFFIFLSSFLLQNTRCVGSGYFVVSGRRAVTEEVIPAAAGDSPS